MESPEVENLTVLTLAFFQSVQEFCCAPEGDADEHCVEAAYHDCSPGRLKDLRAQLEQQMGPDKFKEAYNKIKVVSIVQNMTMYSYQCGNISV